MDMNWTRNISDTVVLVLSLMVVLFCCIPCYAAENGHQLQIQPVSPVRFQGQFVDVNVLTWDTFLQEYTGLDIDCIIEFNNEPSQLYQHSIGEHFTAKFILRYKNLDKSGVINSSVSVYEEDRTLLIQKVVLTNLVVIQEPSYITVVDMNDEGELNCLDPGTASDNLLFEWLKNNTTVGNRIKLSLKPDEDHTTANYTCMIATKEAVEYYGSVVAAFNGGSATSVRRYVSVVSTDRDCSRGDQCNITARLESNKPLDMVITDTDGNVMVQGYPTISVSVNSSVVVQLNISDGSVVLFSKYIKKERSSSVEHEGVSVISAIVIGCIAVVAAFVALGIWCKRRRDNKNNKDNRDIKYEETPTEERSVKQPPTDSPNGATNEL